MKYEIVGTSAFKKELKLINKRHNDLEKWRIVVNKLSNREPLDEKYRDHSLVDSTRFRNCRECHIEPDWLLVYRISNDELILLLVETGSHSDLF